MQHAPAAAESGNRHGEPRSPAMNVGRKLAAAFKSILKRPPAPANHSGNAFGVRADSFEGEDTSGTALKGVGDKTAGRAEKREARLRRQAARGERLGDVERAIRICALGTVEVKKTHKGYRVAVTSRGGRGTFSVASHEVGLVLKDLEAAIQVIHGQN